MCLPIYYSFSSSSMYILYGNQLNVYFIWKSATDGTGKVGREKEG